MPNDLPQENFDRDGFIVLPGFASPEEATGMKARMTELIEAWDPAESKVWSFSPRH